MSGRHEQLDDTPVALPVGFKAPPSMVEMIRMYVRRELSQAAGSVDVETFEEADDFDIEDDEIDPRTPYEAVFDPPAPPPGSDPPAPPPGSDAPAPPPGSDSGSGSGAARVPSKAGIDPAQPVPPSAGGSGAQVVPPSTNTL